MNRPQSLDDHAELLRILGHPMRLGILHALTSGERSVGDMAEQTGLGLSALSQQLALLRKVGLVAARREAKQVFYTIDNGQMDAVRQIINGLSPSGDAEIPVSVHRASEDQADLGAAMFARIIHAPRQASDRSS